MICIFRLLALTYLNNTRRLHPKVWCKPRSHEWWSGVTSGLYGDMWWRENLRTSHDTFEILCNELRPYLKRQTTRFREPVSVEARVAVTVWRFATNVEYRTIAALFGLGRSTACELVIDTCEVITHHLLPKYVCVPKNDRLREIVEGFKQRGFPQAVGAIDGTHIPILRPMESASDYYNRKGFYSVLMQALVEFRGIFMDVNIGWPGKVHDARVFVNSSCYQKANAGAMFPDWKCRIVGVDVPLVILGDPAYPLLPWLMKPYLENASSTRQESNFNYRQNRARMCVENAFGRLKGRWRCLLKRNDSHLCNVPNIVASCVVLHNFCEIFGDSCLLEWIVNDPTVVSHFSSTSTPSSGTAARAAGSRIRDAIRDSI